MKTSLFAFLLTLAVGQTLRADEKPPILDCTGPKGADAATVIASQKAWAKYLGETSHEKSFPLDAARSATIEMVLVPPGKYFRGEEKNATLVTITQPLWVGKYEVTQQQYAVVMGQYPSHFKKSGLDSSKYPAESMSHRQAVTFCTLASERTGAAYRLLHEAEWEYAYRAGSRTKYYNGDSEDGLDAIAHHGDNNRRNPEKVGGKAPNAIGLYDMAGNVWEWCSDYWTGSYDMTTTIDPVGPESGRARVTRGSSWGGSANDCRAAHRSSDAETYAGSHLGFRLARVIALPVDREKPPILDCTGPTGADAKTVAASQRAWARYLGEPGHQKAFPLDAAANAMIEMVLVPPGKYFRGDEKNPVVVTLTKPLWVGKYEVTQQQYETVMGNKPSHFKKEGSDASLYPVEMVSHLDAVKFCKTATSKSEFRLLWQAEWEFAYRAGTRSKYYNGDDDDKVLEIAQCADNNFLAPAKVGSKLPNAFGICDMAGNVAEWCADVWKKDFVETQTIDPRGPESGTNFLNRGNAWDSAGRSCRATGRGVGSQTYGGSQLGFRVARVATGHFSHEMPTLEIIDTHVHFFDPQRPTAPPQPKTDKPLPRPILPEDLKKLAQPLGTVGAIVVEASPLLEDNQWWLDLAAKDPFIVGVVGRLDPLSDDFEKNLRRFAGNPRFRGIRITHNELKAGLNGNLVNRLKLLVDLNLVLDVVGGPDTPADVARLAAELPKLRIVIDHAANLRIDGNEPPKTWRDGMAAAAKHRNVYCKVSALVEQTGRKQAPRDVKHYRPVLDSLWSYFGEDRLIFGSNWPISNGGAPYETVVGIARDYFAEKGERAAAKFFLENAKAVYALQK